MLAAEASRAGQVARGLSDEMHEQRMDREVVPVALDRRRQHQHASRAERALDQQRRAVVVRDQHLVAVGRPDRALSEEAHTMPIARLAQHRMRRRDLADLRRALLAARRCASRRAAVVVRSIAVRAPSVASTAPPAAT